MTSPPLLQFQGIGKAFFGVRVLSDITFDVHRGRVLALLGENGAGKSTLMNILAGNQPADAGTMTLSGQPYAPRNPHDAARHGVALIHQELNLFSNLTVAENLFLTDFPRRAGLPWIDRRTAAERAQGLLRKVGLEISPDTPLERLSAGECQLVEIAKALGTDASVIVFDEPTTSLTHRETERLFELMAELRTAGHAIIFISHNLGDVSRVSDDVVVLRDGQLVARGLASDFTTDQIIGHMVGRQLTQLFPARTSAPTTEPVLELRGVSQPRIIEGIDFTLHRGEVLGLAGLMGSGRSELARIVFGLDTYSSGEIKIAGRALQPDPRTSIQRGVAFLTEDRRHDGLCLEASIQDNVALVALPRHARPLTGWLDRAAISAATHAITEAVKLRARASLAQPVRTLSGGNQQKAVLARWLLAQPGVLILDEPTRGIDVGAKTEIYQLINDAAQRGAGVLVISSELEELIGVCDRILVMNRGEIRDELRRPEFDRSRILRAALHHRATSAAASSA